MALQDCALNLNRAGRELQPHGTPDFPCAGYSSEYTDSAGDVVPWHWHEDLEILYVASGCLRLQVPGKAFHLKQGEGASFPGLSSPSGCRGKRFRIFQKICNSPSPVQDF